MGKMNSLKIVIVLAGIAALAALSFFTSVSADTDPTPTPTYQRPTLTAEPGAELTLTAWYANLTTTPVSTRTPTPTATATAFLSPLESPLRVPTATPTPCVCRIDPWYPPEPWDPSPPPLPEDGSCPPTPLPIKLYLPVVFGGGPECGCPGYGWCYPHQCVKVFLPVVFAGDR